MSNLVAAERYVSADFKNTPLLALADLMGLRPFQSEISSAPEIYAPVLNGICVYRHLNSPDRQRVVAAIRYDIPRNHLTSRLMGLVTDLSVQHYWHLWSLSDDELREFFEFSQAKASSADQFNPLSVPDGLTVASVAAAILATSRKGPRAAVSEKVLTLKDSNLVREIAKRLGFGNKAVTALGVLSIPSILVISGLNIMAKKESEAARRELAARGLLAYSEL